jgi:hypothetical protein
MTDFVLPGGENIKSFHDGDCRDGCKGGIEIDLRRRSRGKSKWRSREFDALIF